MRIWRCWLILGFVLTCAAGWGLSPAAREKILQLKEKYRHETGTASAANFRETARQLREKLQKPTAATPPAEAAETAAAVVTLKTAGKPETPPATGTIVPAVAEIQIPASQPQILAESFEQTDSALKPEQLPGNAAVSREGRDNAYPEASFGEFVVVMIALIVLLSLSGHLVGALPGSMGPGGGVKNIFATVAGGGLVLGIMFLLNEIWQKHLPIVAVLFFCMICPKGLDQAFSSGVGCLAMLAALVFLAPLMLAGNFMLYVVFAFLALFAMRR